MKAIRFNRQRHAEKEQFGDEENLTLHVGEVTVYFDSINESRGSYIFEKNGSDVAFVRGEDCDVSPVAALRVAKENSNQKIPFADN